MDFKANFNARAEEIGHGIRVADMRQFGANYVCTLQADGAPLPEVGLTLEGAEPRGLALVTSMEQNAALCALTVFATAIDTAFGTQDGKLRPRIDPRWRNGVLKRLHLFDGGFSTGREMRTESQGAVFTVRINTPARGLMLMQVKNVPQQTGYDGL